MQLWTCPKCKRAFRQVNQRHSCCVGHKSSLLRGRSVALARLYDELEKVVLAYLAYDGVEIVYRDKYALFRTSRIFADLVMMKDALRLAIHLKREVPLPIFFKIVKGDRGQVGHVAKIRTDEELRSIMPYLVEAHRISADETPG